MSRVLWLTCPIAILIAGTALAFECDKAKSPAEKVICSDPAVKSSDEAMSKSFEDLKPVLDAAQAKILLINQRAWLAQRNQYCAAADTAATCIKEQNGARVLLLTGKAEAGPNSGPQLVPYFVDAPGTKRKPEIHVIMYKQLGGMGPLAKTLDAESVRILASAPKKDAEDADHTVTFERKAKVAFSSDRLISIEIDGWDFMQGAAHGAVTKQMLNIDAKSGSKLKLDDLLDGPAQAKLFGLCMDQLLAVKAERALQEAKETADAEHVAPEPVEPPTPDAVKTLQRASKPIFQRLSSWRFGPDKATILFDQDEIGAHAEGAYDCSFTLRQLRPLVKSGFPLPVEDSHTGLENGAAK